MCPRLCEINRNIYADGVCQTGREAKVSSAFAHFGEEDCLRGTRGSGTIFFTGCNLGCVFCQNWDISQRRGAGMSLDTARLAELMLDLQQQGCHNINFVTPSHVIPQIIESAVQAIDSGLRLPIVYNSSGYDTEDSLKLLDGLVDIYMPDFKFWSPETAKRLANAADYPRRTRTAISEMHRQVGDLRLTPDGIAQRGLLVRQLVMPGMVEESRLIYQWLAREISADTFVNIMGQYRPEDKVGGSRGRNCAIDDYQEINRRPTREELSDAYRAATEAGLWRFDQC